MKIVFMGTPQAAAASLSRLIDADHEVVGVYTQPDRPSGRGKKISFSPVKELAIQQGLPVFQPTKIRTPDAHEEFCSLGADVAVVVAYGRILPEGFLTAFPHGAINVHFSLLPKYRGAAPVSWAIVNGESETGVTTIKMDAGLDTGDILLQNSTKIGENENAVELMERLSAIGAKTLIETLADLGSITPRKQNEADASFAAILKKDDGLIDWTMSAIEIERRVRGFQPFPTSYTFCGADRVTIWNAAAIPSINASEPGSVIEAGNGKLVVACGHESALSIGELQSEGKRRMMTLDFLNGAKIHVGDVLSPDRIERRTVSR